MKATAVDALFEAQFWKVQPKKDVLMLVQIAPPLLLEIQFWKVEPKIDVFELDQIAPPLTPAVLLINTEFVTFTTVDWIRDMVPPEPAA